MIGTRGLRGSCAARYLLLDAASIGDALPSAEPDRTHLLGWDGLV
jgi:hypothetical protein